jgi:cytidylate kinase
MKAIRKDESESVTEELHFIRAHLLHYTNLLEDFRKSVQFIKDTPNPAMEAETMASEKETSKELLDRECDTLLSEISRLEMVRDMQNKRVKNAMNWVSS